MNASKISKSKYEGMSRTQKENWIRECIRFEEGGAFEPVVQADYGIEISSLIQTFLNNDTYVENYGDGYTEYSFSENGLQYHETINFPEDSKEWDGKDIDDKITEYKDKVQATKINTISLDYKKWYKYSDGSVIEEEKDPVSGNKSFNLYMGIGKVNDRYLIVHSLTSPYSKKVLEYLVKNRKFDSIDTNNKEVVSDLINEKIKSLSSPSPSLN